MINSYFNRLEYNHPWGRCVAIVFLLIFGCNAIAQPRQTKLLDEGWKFSKGDHPKASQLDFNDRSWETVTIPHDWAIKGPFGEGLDAQVVQVTADGDKKALLRTGRTGGLPSVGVGWYRKKILMPLAAKGMRCFVEFDGAMSNAVIYLNGDRVGAWPYGYTSFSLELTDKLRLGKDNILAVRLENPEQSSRWYTGAGIYRNVRLVWTHPVHVNHSGTFITTPMITNSTATVHIQTELINQTGVVQSVEINTAIVDPRGKEVAVDKQSLSLTKETTIGQQVTIKKPLLWDIETPRLYKALTKVILNNKVVDVYETPFGIRKIAFDSQHGFLLNGRKIRIKGVCNHHDLGPLGAAINYRALERQLELLKNMGCNAIRTSHNPPAPELLDLCDKMGFIVMDEAFDEWKIPKTKNGYNKLFDEWAEKDLRAMIRRDRNHPSIVLWSIGNEVQEQGRKEGVQTAKFLVDIAHTEDSTRLVTSAFNRLSDAIKNGLAEVVDVVGFNYRTQNYLSVHTEHPNWKLIGSETESAVSSRGVYMFPVAERKSYKYPNKQSSSYDQESPNWGVAPDVEFARQDSNEFVAGQFTWTGFDYLGEPTPYTNDWPSHSSYFGIIDLTGIPKDRYYLYQSHWSNKKVLHLLPHWNWEGREREITPVHCYTSYHSAELFINGKSQGIKTKDAAARYGRYRLTWDSVRYMPGEIKVVAYDDHGRKVDDKTIRTAGKPYRIQLIADRKQINATGKDLSYITVQVLDTNGNICPKADNNISFKIEGAGFIRGVGNGDPTNVQDLTGHEMQAFNGQCMVILQSLKKKGDIKVTASAEGLKHGIVYVKIL